METILWLGVATHESDELCLFEGFRMEWLVTNQVTLVGAYIAAIKELLQW